MSAWIVYSKDGSVERCVLKSLEYGGTAMGERAVTATFDSNSEVDFEVFDYIEYRGEKFELEAVPTVKKVSSFEYIYELRFVSLKYELERCEMRDLVPYDNEVVYPTPLTFSFTGNVRYLTERIQACLDTLYGSGTWNIIIDDGVESEEKNITIAQQNCWNALALVSSTYGLSFYIKGRTITIGGEQPLVGHTFEYGKGNGLYEIERASDTNTGIVTKLRAYGGTRNLDYSYPKRPEWSDSALPVTFAFSPLRLMLPSFKYDGKTDYVLADSATIAKYGIREASMVYDDIYPSITGATHNGQAIDEIKAVEEVDDNAETFVVYLHDLGFDLEEHLTTSDAQISMKTGAMQGYTFNMAKIEKQYENTATADVTGEVNPDENTPDGDTPEENLGEFIGYKITLNRISAEGGDNYNIPNSDWSMKAGDKFVLLNILMPQMYIREAENRLKERAEEYLAQYGKTNFSYNIGLHDKFLIENPSVYDSLIEGSKLRVRDSEIGIDEEVTIQSITITENAEDNILPQVKVTLNNEPSASTLERIQGRIDALANESAAGNFATQSEIMAQYRKKLDKPYFDKLFVAVDSNGKDIPSNDMTTPVAYIKAKYHFAVVGGITSFVDDVDLDLPSIYDGLPIDYQTLYWEETTNEDGSVTKVLKARGIGEGGEGGNTGGGLSVADIKTLIESYGYLTESKLPVASNSVKGIASFNSEQFSVVNGVVSFIGSTNNTPDLSGYVTKAEFFPFQDEFGLFVSVVNQHTISIREIKTTYATQEWVREAISGLESGSGGGVADTIAWDKVYGKPSWLSDNGINYEDIIGTPDLTTYATKDYVNKAISNLGSSGGGSVADSIAWDKVFGKPGWLNDDVIHYSEIDGTPDLDGYALKTELPNLSEYVDIKSEQTITGKKNFTTGGLFVNGKQIKYNSEGYWMLEGDLLVTGGITSFASASGFTPSTVMDGVVVDGTTIIKQDGKLVVVGGGSSGGVADSVAWGSILGKPSWIGDTKPSYSYSEISGTPDLSKYLTSHQTIYDLTFQSGQFTADTFKPNGSPKTINIPTTTAHISESTNVLYFTNERAVAALKDTLSYYVDLTNEQEIEGRKNFTGGLLVNGQELVYNKDGYWKMEGNLLVTGGITTYSTDGNESPFMVDAASIDLITSESTTQVYTARATKLIKDEVISVGIDASDALDKLDTIKSELASITDTSLISVIRTALINIREKI